MFVIGYNEYQFISITRDDTMYDGKNLWKKIKKLEYESPLNEATIFTDYEAAVCSLKEIRDNANEITFSNNRVIGEILDKKSNFDKVQYSKGLRIYELVPTLL